MKAKMNEITLKMWAVRPTSGGVCIDGLRVGDETGIHWHSSTITKRIRNRLLETASGSRYRLVGDLDDSYAKETSDYLRSVISKFKRGFPAKWKAFIETAKKASTETRGVPSKQAPNLNSLNTNFSYAEPGVTAEMSVCQRRSGFVFTRSTEDGRHNVLNGGIAESTRIMDSPENQQLLNQEDSLEDTLDGTIFTLRKVNLRGGYIPSKRKHDEKAEKSDVKRRKVESKCGKVNDIFLTPDYQSTDVDMEDDVLQKRTNRSSKRSSTISPSKKKCARGAELSAGTTSFIRLPVSDETLDRTLDTSFFDCILAVERQRSRSVTPKSAKWKNPPPRNAAKNRHKNSGLHNRKVINLDNGKVVNNGKVSNVKSKRVKRLEPTIGSSAVVAVPPSVGGRRSVRLMLKAEGASARLAACQNETLSLGDVLTGKKIACRIKTGDQKNKERSEKCTKTKNCKTKMKPKSANSGRKSRKNKSKIGYSLSKAGGSETSQLKSRASDTSPGTGVARSGTSRSKSGNSGTETKALRSRPRSKSGTFCKAIDEEKSDLKRFNVLRDVAVVVHDLNLDSENQKKCSLKNSKINSLASNDVAQLSGNNGEKDKELKQEQVSSRGKKGGKINTRKPGIHVSGIKLAEKNTAVIEIPEKPSKIRSKKSVSKQHGSEKRNQNKDIVRKSQKKPAEHKSSNGTSSELPVEQLCNKAATETSKGVSGQSVEVNGCHVLGQSWENIGKNGAVTEAIQPRQRSSSKNLNNAEKVVNLCSAAEIPDGALRKSSKFAGCPDASKMGCAPRNVLTPHQKKAQVDEVLAADKANQHDLKAVEKDISPVLIKPQVARFVLLGGKGTLKRQRALKQLIDDNIRCKQRNDFFSSTPFRTAQARPLVIPELLDNSDDVFGEIDQDLVVGLKNTNVTPHGLNHVMDYTNNKTPSDMPSVSKTPAGVKPLRKQIDAYVFHLKKKSYFNRRRRQLSTVLKKSQPTNQVTPRSRPAFAMDSNVLDGVSEIPQHDSDEEVDNYFD